MPAVGPPDQTRPPASPLQRDMWLCDIDDTRFQPGPQEFRLRVSSGNLADGLIDQAAAVLAAVIRGPAPAGSHPVATSVMRSGWDGGQTAAEVWVSQSMW
jgi:hypothetical protein